MRYNDTKFARPIVIIVGNTDDISIQECIVRLFHQATFLFIKQTDIIFRVLECIDYCNL